MFQSPITPKWIIPFEPIRCRLLLPVEGTMRSGKDVLASSRLRNTRYPCDGYACSDNEFSIPDGRNRRQPTESRRIASGRRHPRKGIRNFVIIPLLLSKSAPLAQLDRASGYEPEGREFESLRARHKIKDLGHPWIGCPLFIVRFLSVFRYALPTAGIVASLSRCIAACCSRYT